MPKQVGGGDERSRVLCSDGVATNEQAGGADRRLDQSTDGA
jgi:hypothetical protein